MDGSFGIIFFEKSKKVLLVKRRDIPIWVLPGGRIETGETPEQAVVREVFEETGFNVLLVKKVGEYFYSQKSKINHTFICEIISGEKTLSNESKAIEQFEVKNLPNMISPHISIYIKDALNNEESIIKKEMYGYAVSFWLKGLLHPWALFKYLLTRVGIHWNT
ncbi:MAG: NUDIX hydrolase [Patescibacteria group bacterium]